jgi:hypothetical protein
MCRRSVLRWVFCKWECAHAAACREADCTERDAASDSQISAVFYCASPLSVFAPRLILCLQVSSPSISLSELQSSFQTDQPDFERLISGIRQQLHVQTLQEKLQRDSDELARTISALKVQVQVPARCFDDEHKPGSAAGDDRTEWQRKLVKPQFMFLAFDHTQCFGLFSRNSSSAFIGNLSIRFSQGFFRELRIKTRDLTAAGGAYL